MHKQSILFVGEDNFYTRELQKQLSPNLSFIFDKAPKAIDIICKQKTPLLLIIVDSADNDAPIEIVRQIRAKTSEIAVIVTTMSPEWKSAREAMQAGADDYIPLYKTDDILQLIHEITEKAEP